MSTAMCIPECRWAPRSAASSVNRRLRSAEIGSIAVGSNDEILKLKGPETNVIELGGKFVMPGFNDAHTHLAAGGFEKLTVNLVGAKSLDEFRERIRAKAEKAEPNAWIVGGGWDETLWPVKTVPTRWDIDEVTTNHPVFLQRVDGHVAVANTRALQLASVTLASKQPEGGKIDRDQMGSRQEFCARPRGMR